MEPRYLYTIRWSQPYATYQMRPYLRRLREDYEQVIEARLARQEFSEAQEAIQRIMSL
jgi:hypothetical protein